jgi:DNA-binding transcriptional LysR family regulator
MLMLHRGDGELTGADRFVIPRRVEYLIALAREGHFARAAASCNVSQPTLSAGIQQLEHDLGVLIVRRGQRFQGLTEEGEMVLAWAQRSIVESQHLAQQLRDRVKQLARTLQVGYLASISPLVPALTILFASRYPNIKLRVIRFRDAAAIQQGLDEYLIDVGLTYVDEPHRRNFRWQELYTEQYHLLVRRGGQFHGRTELDWNEIRAIPLCAFTPESQVLGLDEVEMLWSAERSAPQIATDSIYLVMDHVRTGNWASVVPRAIMPMIAVTDGFEAIPLAQTGQPAHWGVVIPLRDPASPPAEALFEVAASEEFAAIVEAALRQRRQGDSQSL